jgi:nitroreductase
VAEITPRLTVREGLRSIWRILAARPRIPPSLADNELLQTILERRSVRRFANRPVEDDVFDAVLEAGRVAPSTVNLQSWTFMSFTAESWRTTFGRGMPFKAQRAVIICGDAHRYRRAVPGFPREPLVEYTLAVMNASLAAMNMNVAAEALGVSSVMLSETGRSGLLDSGYLKRVLGLPQRVVPLMTMVFGYPAGAQPPMPPKLPMDQVCFTDARYHEADETVLEDWMVQMTAGYKASHPFSSMEAQLDVYRSKIVQAENDLHEAIFGAEDTGAHETGDSARGS